MVRSVSTRTRGAVYDALAALPQGWRAESDEPAWFDLSTAPGTPWREVRDLIGSREFDAWSEALGRVGNCERPIRLRGQSTTLEATTGEVVATYRSDVEPLGVTHVRCGNRREDMCASCARLYAADMFHLIRAGIIGGKTVPERVAENPLVFLTVTGPSFGLVHSSRDGASRCHPYVAGDQGCPHGRPRTCHARHCEGDQELGQPLCPQCYDYASHVVWQWWAPDLWRRLTIALRRLVAKTLAVPAPKLGDVATLQYAKVAEYQVRGVVHFHALVRLDGPRTSEGFAAAPSAVDAGLLADLARRAAASVRLRVPGVDQRDAVRILAFGRQVDARTVDTGRRTDDPGRVLSPDQVAGYLAKYATKSAGGTGVGDNAHLCRIRTTCRELAARATAANIERYVLMGKWVSMLGFRGHFASKSRRYSVTLGALRRARRRAQALIAQSRSEGRPLDLASLEADLLADDEERTTLVVGQWQYVGSGWATEGQRVLAAAAAARAREYDQWRAEQARTQQASRKGHRRGQGDGWTDRGPALVGPGCE